MAAAPFLCARTSRCFLTRPGPSLCGRLLGWRLGLSTSTGGLGGPKTSRGFGGGIFGGQLHPPLRGYRHTHTHTFSSPELLLCRRVPIADCLSHLEPLPPSSVTPHPTGCCLDARPGPTQWGRTARARPLCKCLGSNAERGPWPLGYMPKPLDHLRRSPQAVWPTPSAAGSCVASASVLGAWATPSTSTREARDQTAGRRVWAAAPGGASGRPKGCTLPMRREPAACAAVPIHVTAAPVRASLHGAQNRSLPCPFCRC